MNHEQFDCAVVGSGAGGLSAAIAAAQEGLSVTVLEASSRFGGYMNPFKRRGYEFDTGLHIVGGLEGDGTLRSTLVALGVFERLHFLPLNQECTFRLLIAQPKFEFCIPRGLEPMRDRLLETFPAEAKGIQRFITMLSDCREAVRAIRPRFRLGRVVKMLPRLYSVLRTLRMTYAKYLDTITYDPILRAVLAFNWATYGLPPSRASALYALLVSADLASPYYPAGGSRKFRDTLVVRALELGVDMRKNSEVVHITREKDMFVLHIANGKRVQAQTVICNADPYHLYGRILDRSLVPSKMLEKVSRTRYSMGMFCAYIGTKFDPSTLGLDKGMAGVFENPDIDTMWERTWTSEEGVMFGHFAVFSPSLQDKEGGHAPRGKHVVEILAPAAYAPFAKWANTKCMKRGPEYEQFKLRLGQRLLDKVEQFFPGLTCDAEHIEFSTPLTNQWWVRAPFGACYGPDQTPEQIGPGRFGIVSPIPGLFLCGAATEGGGVSPCMHSGLAAARKTVAFLKKRNSKKPVLKTRRNG